MSDTSNGLAIYLMFDEIENGKVLDGSSNGYDGTVQGAVSLVPDDMFGSCLSFDQDGDDVSLPEINIDFSNGLTLEVWAQFSNFDKQSPVLDFRNETSSDSIVFANEATTSNLVLDILSKSAPSTIKVESVLTANKWTHLAATVDKTGSATLYVDGQARQTGENIGLPSGATLTSNYIGKSNSDGGVYFRGKIASLRVYTHALTEDEIKKDMEADKSASASFRLSYPVGFRLYDDNDQEALYITGNPEGLPLNIDLSNTSQYEIQLAAPATATASADNYHFQLLFRPGTLLAPTSITVKESGWNLKVESAKSGDSLYLLRAQAMAFASEEKIHLTLRHVRADGSGGARGTRVELKYKQLNYSGDTIELKGSRVQHLSVINHSGEVIIPLHAGFKGSELILNDGTSSNDLTLLIYNVSKKGSISLNPQTSPAPSKFIFSFDSQGEGEQKDWALGTTDQVQGIDISADGWAPSKETIGESPEWILTNMTRPSLEVGEVVEVNISNVISSLPSGHTNIYVRYENFPGYWDGQLIRIIEKAPLQYVGSNIGIGTVSPRTELDLGTGVMSGAANDYLKAQFSLTGGGTITWGGPGQRLKWTTRFIAISMERSKTFEDGHVEINQPTTDLPAEQVYDGKARSANADGIVLNDWEALYAVHTVGGNKSAVSFRIVSYLAAQNFFAPSNWILVAAVNNDEKTVKLGTGTIVNANSSASKGNGLPCGTIVMWHGDTNAIPDGWALCNGGNGTPNLLDRFIVGAGHNYKPGDMGGADSVQLKLDQMPAHSHDTAMQDAGSHTHLAALDTGSGGDDQERNMATGGSNKRNTWYSTEAAGEHTHVLSLQNAGGGNAHENRPAYYAVCFIMKLF